MERVSASIKFCGLTRAEDAEYAATLGAAYVGVIFAGGKRHRTIDEARDVLKNVPRSVQRVGVFADQPADEICRIATAVELDVLQLHGRADADRIAELRNNFAGEIWPVVRAKNGELPEHVARLMETGDALVLDAHAEGMLGGTGVSLPWNEMAPALRSLRSVHDTPLILAGGLTPETVARAIAALSPDVVDVSSGVERAPGIKDHTRMLAFRNAVTHASILT